MAYGYIVGPEPRGKYSTRRPKDRGQETRLCKRPRIGYVCGMVGENVRVRVVECGSSRPPRVSAAHDKATVVPAYVPPVFF